MPTIAPDAPPSDDLDLPVPRSVGRPPRWTRVCMILGAVLVVLSSAALFVGGAVAGRYENSLNRDDLLGDADRPPPKVDGPLTFLIIGSDSRAGDNHNPDTPDGNVAAVSGERSDTIILVHVPASMDTAYVISIPRDSYVPIAEKKGDGIAGRDKVNAAYADGGGASRLVKTINHFAGIQINYPVIVDFAAIRKITDLVGGVDVVVKETTYDPYRFLSKDTKYPVTKCWDPSSQRSQRCVTFPKGKLHLDGQYAEYYVRQRNGLPGGDLDRAQRQQQYLRALMAKAASNDLLTDWKKLDRFARTVAGSLTVDESMPVQGLAFALKGLRTENLVFMTLPIAGSGNEPGSGSVLYPDKAKSKELFDAMNNGTLPEYVVKYPPNDVTQGS